VETWVAVAVVGIGLIPAALIGLQWYMGATATQLHPVPADVPSRSDPVPLPRWSGAVEDARQAVRAELAGHNLPGMSVAVGIDGDVAWAEGFGWADIESGEPVTPATRFRIGTTSIALTSAGAGALLEDGRLKLDDVVPTFPELQQPITLRQLMAHVAGIANDGGDEGPLFGERCARPADALPFLSGYERQLRFEPGTQYRFSSYGWIMVSAAIEAAAGEPFFTFMQRRVFEPSGMRDTMPDSAADAIPDRATFYFPRFAADPRYGLQLTRPLDYSCYAGASAFLSTPSDLVRFGMAINRGELLQLPTVQLLQTSQRLTSGEETGYGLGWDVESVTVGGALTRAVGHDGMSLGGAVASLTILPDHGVVVAVASNMSYADTPGVAARIAQAFAAPRTGVD
jgi:CubicO group peptidase (beta-lactamase class C family)